MNKKSSRTRYNMGVTDALVTLWQYGEEKGPWVHFDNSKLTSKHTTMTSQRIVTTCAQNTETSIIHKEKSMQQTIVRGKTSHAADTQASIQNCISSAFSSRVWRNPSLNSLFRCSSLNAWVASDTRSSADALGLLGIALITFAARLQSLSADVVRQLRPEA